MGSESMKDVGFLYFAKGEAYRREAVKSAKQTNRIMPNIPIAIYVDEPTGSECFSIEIIDNTSFAKRDKATALINTPFDKTVYLDSDIHIQHDISETLELLEQFDMAIAQDPSSHHLRQTDANGIPDSFPEFNTGVIVFEKDNLVREMLESWESKCEEWHTADQHSFRKALFEGDLRFTLLPRRYNYMYRAPAQVRGKVKIFHGALTDHRDPDIYGIDVEEARKINEQTTPRVSFKIGNNIAVNPPTSRLDYFVYYLRYAGPRQTANKGLEFLFDRIAMIRKYLD